jgi:hypothetical protein
MVEKVVRLGIKKEKGYLYYLDQKGVFKVKMDSQGRASGKPALVKDLELPNQRGFLYFVDRDGDVARSPVKD